MQHIITILIAILIFGLIIGIHEFGHFIVAKLNHIQVNQFAIGMGPKLIHFQKGETEYSLRLFPIGGFCAMEGEDQSSDNPNAFEKKAVWRRMTGSGISADCNSAVHSTESAVFDDCKICGNDQFCRKYCNCIGK
jgi:RIP metalloprotease RseP